MGMHEDTELCLTTKAMMQAALDFLRDLAGEWEWKRNSIQKNNKEMAELDHLIRRLEHVAMSESKDTNADAFGADAQLVASFRLPVNVKGLIVLGDWLRRQYGEGLTMWQQGDFLFVMKPTEEANVALRGGKAVPSNGVVGD